MTRLPFRRFAAFPVQLAAPSLRRTALVHALLIAMAGGALVAAAPAQAETVVQAERRSWNIPAGPLDAALVRFAAEAGVSFSFEPSIVAGREGQAVSGQLTVAEALAQLLAGSGLRAEQGESGVIRLHAVSADAAVTLAPVKVKADGIQESAYGPVEGYVAKRSATGTKTDTPLIEIPQVINVITADQIRDFGAQSIGQSLRYTPGVYSERTGSIVSDDNLTIRGFTARTYLDGTRQPLGDLTGTQIDPYGLERVEVLKGPASVLYGRSAPGGIANLVRKRPGTEVFGEVELLSGRHSRIQGKFDVNTPLDDEQQFLLRLTGLAREADTQMNYVEDDRSFLAASFAWRPTEQTDLNLFASWQDDKSGVGSFFPEGTLLPNPNGEMPSDVYLGSRSDGYLREQYMAGYHFDHDFGNGLQFRSSANYTETEASLQYPLVYGLEEDGRTASRYLGITPEDFEALTLDNSLEIALETGALSHRVLVGIDYLRAKANRDDQPIYFDSDFIDIYNPDNSTGELGDRYTQLYFTQEQYGVYLQDQMAINDLRITLGLRHDSAETDSWLSYATPQNTEQRDSEITYRAGAVYLFDNGLAPFVSYSTSFEPEPGATFEGELFEPLTGEQLEAGLRYQPVGANFYVTASVFEIVQQNVLAPDPVNQFFSVQLGEVRSRGIEIEAKATLTDGLDLTAAFSRTDAEVKESTDADQIGKKVHFVPPVQASMWAHYDLGGTSPVGVTVGAGVRYVGEQEGDANNTPALKLPSYTIYDASLAFDIFRLTGWGEGLSAQVNINNVTDERYVTGCSSSYYAFCYLGQERTLLGSINYKW